MSLSADPSFPAGLVRTAQVLDAAYIDWAVLRWAIDPDGPPGDIDILVPAGRRDAAARCLIEEGFVAVPGAAGNTAALWRYDRTVADWVWVDLHDSIAAPGRPPDPALVEALLGRRRRAGGVWMLQPQDELWAILLRLLVDRRPLQERHQRRLTQLTAAAADPSPLRAWLDEPGGTPPTTAEVLALVRAARWQELYELVPPAAPSRTARIPTGLHSIAAVRRTFRTRGVSVALLGPDGAGKSSTAALLARRFPFPSRIVYMGVGQPPGARQATIRMLGTAIAGAATQWLRYLRALASQLRGRLVIFDRYVEDPWLPQPAGRSAFRHIGHRLRRAVAPPPADVMVVLDVPGEVMFERKREHDPDWLEAQRQRYRRLGEQVPRATLVDAGSDPASVVIQVEGQVWDRYRERLSVATAHHDDQSR